MQFTLEQFLAVCVRTDELCCWLWVKYYSELGVWIYKLRISVERRHCPVRSHAAAEWAQCSVVLLEQAGMINALDDSMFCLSLCPWSLLPLNSKYLSIQSFLKSHISQYIVVVKIIKELPLKLHFLIKIFILSDQTGSWGADRAARHGRAGKRLPGPQHPCL